MKRTVLSAVICFLTSTLQAQFGPDTAFVRFSGDTVKICHINVLENCAAGNISTAEIRSDTIFVVESDTSLAFARCVCLFDFTTSLVGLGAGNYVAVISTASRRSHPPTYDTLRTRWSPPFRVMQGSQNASVSSSVTPCHGSLLTPAWTPTLYPLQTGNIWEYAEDFTTYTYQTFIARDTLMPNGHTYAVMQSQQWIVGYARQQGDTVFEYSPMDSSDHLLYDFTRSPGDTIVNRIHYSTGGQYADTTSMVLVATGTMRLFERNLRYWSFYKDIKPYIDDEVTATIVDSIGLYDLRPGFGPWEHLRGAKIDGIGYGLINAIENKNMLPAGGYELVGNYPNPFNPKTRIRFTVGRVVVPSNVRLVVYDLLGKEVAVLVNEQKPAGEYSVVWDGKDSRGRQLSSGVYLCRLTAGSFTQTKQMVLVR
jgi:hypothetical protein